MPRWFTCMLVRSPGLKHCRHRVWDERWENYCWILQDRILECVAGPLLREIFPTQGSNPGIPHCWRILYQPRILEWVAYPFSRGSFRPRNWSGVSHIAGGFFANWPIREVDGRRGKIALRIKPFTHQRCLEGANKTLCTPGPRRKEQWPHKRLSQTYLWVSRSTAMKLKDACSLEEKLWPT